MEICNKEETKEIFKILVNNYKKKDNKEYKKYLESTLLSPATKIILEHPESKENIIFDKELIWDDYIKWSFSFYKDEI